MVAEKTRFTFTVIHSATCNLRLPPCPALSLKEPTMSPRCLLVVDMLAELRKWFGESCTHIILYIWLFHLCLDNWAGAGLLGYQ